MKFKSYDDVQKYLVLNKTDLLLQMDSFNDVPLLDVFNKEQITDLMEIFSHKIFISYGESSFLSRKKIGGIGGMFRDTYWKFFKKQDNINSDISFGLIDQYGAFILESEELIMGKTFKEISEAISKEIDYNLIQLKSLAEKAKNFRETEYFESNKQRSTREAEENYFDVLIDEMSMNFEQTGIFETTEERYNREVIDNENLGQELPNNSEKQLQFQLEEE